MIVVRLATEADLPAMSEVLIASITELCALDHGDDPVAIAAWTANKTVDGVRTMRLRPGSTLLVAVDGKAMLAVGCIADGNRIGLNYVAPAYRFRGASATLLADMERRIRSAGYPEARLESTRTAREFYLARGWEEIDPSGEQPGYPMRKTL